MVIVKYQGNTPMYVFPGRFQPIHLGHLYVYDFLCKKYGAQNVWLASSNKQSIDSPLTFKQKKKLATELFSIPEDRFVYTQIPYVPESIMEKDLDRPCVLVLGEKDSDRLKASERFEVLTPETNLSTDKIYILHVPMFADSRSASSIRAKFKDPNISLKEKANIFEHLFGAMDEDIFKTLVK